MSTTRSGSLRTHHPVLALVAILAAMALVLGACGDDSGSSSSDTTAGAADDTGTADPEGVIQQGYSLVATASGGFTLNPVEVGVSITEEALFRQIYGSLLRPTADGTAVPDLAESTDVPDDNTVVITIREGATFSDGTPFDAAAVKAGLDYSLENGNPAGFAETFFAPIAVEVTDPQTVTVTFDDGTAQAWHDNYLSSWETTIVKPDDDFSMPTGAGPFEITEYAPEESMTLVKRDDYWDADSILVAGIDITHVSDGQAAVSALSADQVDIARIEAAQADGLTGGDAVLFAVDPSALSSLQLCKSEAPLDDVDVRRALNFAIDRVAIVDALYGGAFEPAAGIWPAGNPFHDPANEDAFVYDPEAAQELLDGAGFGDGLEFDMYVIDSGGMPEVGEVVQAQFAEIGVTANIVPAPNYVNDFLTANAAGAGLIPVMGDPKYLQWSMDTIGNSCGYDDPALNDLAAELDTVSPTSEEAADLWKQIETIVADEALSTLLFFGGNPSGYSTERLGDAAVEPGTIPFVDPRVTFVKAG